MRRVSSFGTGDQLQRLELELHQARLTILYLVPEAFREHLTGYKSCKSNRDLYVWERESAEAIAEMAKPLHQENPLAYPRAYCPLCGRGSRTPYKIGFSLPEGMLRHLTGWGDVPRCDVMEAAMGLACEHLEIEIRPIEEAARVEEEAKLARRRKTETIYRTAPDLEPVLFDEGLRGAIRRNVEQLAWAEQRVIELGLRGVQNGNVQSYVDDRDHVVVYADLRCYGEISFQSFTKPLPKRFRHSQRRRSLIGSFSLLDGWNRKLRDKYEDRLREVVELKRGK